MHSLKGLYQTFCNRRTKLKCVFSSLEFQKYWSKFVVWDYIYALKLFLSSVATDGEGDMEWNLKNWANFFFSSFISALAKIINKLLWLVLPGKIYFISSKLYRNVRELKQRRPRRQRGRQKSNGVRLAKEKLCTCITLFYTFLCCRCMTTMWNCLIWHFVEDVNTRQWPSFSFSEL